MNAKLKFRLPCNISFEDCKLVPIAQKQRDWPHQSLRGVELSRLGGIDP